MKIGKKEGCIFNDRIDIELSPSKLWDLIRLAEKDALDDKDYSSQGIKRKLKDILQERYDEWENKRESINEQA